MKNRFNRLTSKEWLPFQKSWFKFESIYQYIEKISVFTNEDNDSVVIYVDYILTKFKKFLKKKSQITLILTSLNLKSLRTKIYNLLFLILLTLLLVKLH